MNAPGLLYVAEAHCPIAGDIITITFDVDTNRPQLSSKEAVDQLITFSSPVGTDYSGAWSSAKVLVITLNAVGTGVDPAATRPDVLSISLKAAGNVKTSDLSSPASTSSATVTGTWGDAACACHDSSGG